MFASQDKTQKDNVERMIYSASEETSIVWSYPAVNPEIMVCQGRHAFLLC